MKNSNFLSIINFAGGRAIQIILVLLLGYNNLLGQANTCGTPTNQTDVTPTANNAPAGPFFVKTYLHVIRKSDKSGGLTVEDVNSVIPFLNSDYNLHNIYFSLACVNYIDNTSLYFNDGNLLLQEITPNSQSFRADGLNIYLIPFGVPLTAEFSGKAHDIRSQSLYIYYRQNDRNITHEVGHCLGLYHTFRGTCVESAPFAAAFAQPNCPTCDVTGDLVADTPGDDGGYLPQCAQGTPYTSCNQGCCDPNNNLFVLSDPKNIMSYGGMNCWQYFTPGQGERMRTLIKPEMLLSAYYLNRNYGNDYRLGSQSALYTDN
jgi:Pregnancy-associated plasma protein-A